jgi:hypothetical protein
MHRKLSLAVQMPRNEAQHPSSHTTVATILTTRWAQLSSKCSPDCLHPCLVLIKTTPQDPQKYHGGTCMVTHGQEDPPMEGSNPSFINPLLPMVHPGSTSSHAESNCFAHYYIGYVNKQGYFAKYLEDGWKVCVTYVTKQILGNRTG